jgi:(p)ppGpp synthase/HD superfamily hydrolase
VTIETIEQEFGSEVAEIVGWLTDVSKPEDGNRAVRKAIDREHSAQAPASAQTVKCCDLISNTRSIVRNDPEFAKIYLIEKRSLLEVMTKAHSEIMEEAIRVMEEAERDLQLSK